MPSPKNKNGLRTRNLERKKDKTEESPSNVTEPRSGKFSGPAGTSTDSLERKNVHTDSIAPAPSPLRQALRLFYWGTLLAQFLITSISLTFLYCNTYFWPITTSRGAVDWAAFLHLLIFCLSSALTQYNFFMAIFVGPGFVPQRWKPEKEEHQSLLQFCHSCGGFKAPRAHHCRKCGRCVQKMEHHCPWINNCVGHRNHAYFIRFLFFATMGCLQAMTVLLIVALKVLNFVFTDYHYNQRLSRAKAPLQTWFSYWMRLFNFQPPTVFFSVPGLLWLVIMIGFAFGVVVAVGVLFVLQLRIVLKNETSIESWILNKASYYLNEENASESDPDKKKKTKQFSNPYHLGWWKNIQQVFLNRSLNPEGDGIFWPVLPGCDQFTLTKEQIRQKQFKNDASVDFIAVESYDGAPFPLFSQGCRVCMSFPWTIDEQRLSVSPGDVVRCTRFQKHWLYGAKLVKSALTEDKGWFPRRVSRRADSKSD